MATHNATLNSTTPTPQLYEEQWLNACKTGVGAWLDFCSAVAGNMEQLRKLQIEVARSLQSKNREIAEDIGKVRDFASLATAQSRLVPQYMAELSHYWTGYMGLLQRARKDLQDTLNAQAQQLGVTGDESSAEPSPVSVDRAFRAARSTHDAFLKTFTDWAGAAAHFAPMYIGGNSPAPAHRPSGPGLRKAA